MPTISVIVPVYKVEQYIHRCIDSILAQTFTDFELLLVDDGSPDNCGAICDEYAAKDSRVRVLHQENKGQAAARNLALDWMYANSDSGYIAFVDSDDWVHPRYLELLYRAIQEYGVNISQCLHMETDGTKELPKVAEHISAITVEEQYLHHYSAFVWEKLFCKQCFQEIRFPEGQIYEDVAIWYKILFAEEHVALVKETLYYYFINESSTVRSNWTPARLAQIRVWDEQIEFLSRHENERVLDEALSRFFWVLQNQGKEIEESTRIPDDEKKRYQAQIRKRTKRLLGECKDVLHNSPRYWRYYSQAHPKLSWCYWTVRGVGSKIKGWIK